MSDTVTKLDPFSVEDQAADLRRMAADRASVANYTIGAIKAYTRQGGPFDDLTDAQRLEYVRNALAAADLVRAELLHAELAGR